MPVFICEKCGRLDNSANDNNFWQSQGNKGLEKEGKPYLLEFEDPYFNTHSCCSLCCKGINYLNSTGHFNGGNPEYISDYTYKDVLDKGWDLSGLYNYKEIMERDYYDT